MKRWKLICLLSSLSSFAYAESEVQPPPTPVKATYQVSAHILDINRGRPAENVEVELYKMDNSQKWVSVEKHITNDNGYIGNFLKKGKDAKGVYKLVFQTKDYFTDQGVLTMYPFVEVSFSVKGDEHYHFPLLLSGNGFSPMALTR